MTEIANKPQPDHWSEWRARAITRVSFLSGKSEPLDPGVNFFVEALENAGAFTKLSCEGHPTGFYITFLAGYRLAMQVAAANCFSVEIEGQEEWTLRLNTAALTSEDDKNAALRQAAAVWVSKGLIPYELQERRNDQAVSRGARLA